MIPHVAQRDDRTPTGFRPVVSPRSGCLAPCPSTVRLNTGDRAIRVLSPFGAVVDGRGGGTFFEQEALMFVDVCDCCGSELEGEARFVAGKTWCARCWRGREPPTPQPVSEAGKRQIQLWLAPKAQPEGARHG